MSLQPKPQLRRPVATKQAPSSDEESHPRSPTIDEDEEAQPEETPSIDQIIQPANHAEDEQDTVPEPEPVPPIPPEPMRSRTASMHSRTNIAAESRAADRKEVEQLKAKLRSMEKKEAEDRAKLQKFDTVQTDKDRYETIIQTLQKKLKGNQQTISELRTLKEQAEQKASEIPQPSGESESVLELAKLDKEMAEERAELAQAELDILRSKHEELELELDILREENRELGSTMSPEELSSAGWLQKEREVERLRHALGLLRDHSREAEDELQSQIKELQESVDEAEKVAALYDETVQKLSQVEATNQHLIEQLEDAETNDEVVVALEAQREQNAAMIERLKKQIQEFEEHIQVTDELEKFHVEEERQLHYDLDESEAQLSERERQVLEQGKVIEDLEFSLNKFKGAILELQSDMDELRRSRDMNETQANEMSVKSRAMMDLNLQLQNSAAKSQLKTIDYEMRDMQAEQARSHLEIVQLFIPDSFDQDRNPVLAMLALKRVRSKASLVKTVLLERMRDRPHLMQDDPFAVFEVIEKMDCIAASCLRFLQFINTCSPEQFGRFSGAVYELEPVERSVTIWIEALRRDELGTESAESLQRMLGILLDMSEKLIDESGATKATELVGQVSLTERYADITAMQVQTLSKIVQIRLGEARDDDEEAMAFEKKFEAFANRARTLKYLASKANQALNELRAGSMCLGETSWIYFDDAERSAAHMSQFVREIGKAVVIEFGKVEEDGPVTYSSVADLMTAAAKRSLEGSEISPLASDDVFTLIAGYLSRLQAKIDELQSKAADISSAVEFEVSPAAPWVARAKRVKEQKLLSQDTAEELSRLKAKSDSQLRDLAEKVKETEEMRIRVDVLESRQRESKAKDGEFKTLKDELDRIKIDRANLVDQLEKTTTDMEEALAKREKDRDELNALKNAALAEGGASAAQVVSALGDASGETSGLLKVETDLMKAEILNLQAAVRYLRSENHTLRVPVGEIALRAERNAWLDPANLKATRQLDQRKERVRREGRNAYDGLIELATSAQCVKLKQRQPADSGKWQKMDSTTRWHVARQKEVLEHWKHQVDETVRRAKFEMHPSTAIKYGLPPLAGSMKPMSGPEARKVRILDVSDPVGGEAGG
jgi:dynactin 1